MKALIVAVIVVTVAWILFRYKRQRDLKALWLSLGSMGAILALGIMGSVTRTILPLYLAHMTLVLFAWCGLLYYMVRGRYVWWAILSPLATIVLFILLSLLEGSRYEDIWSGLF